MTTPTGWADPAWRRWHVESIRRSLAMLRPGQLPGLTRDEAMSLVTELQALQGHLEHLKDELRRLADEA
jgi:hypothetical protein